MAVNKENWISQVMETMNYRLVEEHMKEYNVSEYEARMALAEMFYNDTFNIKTDKKDKEVTGYLQY